ncbi:interferon lambda-4-like [Mustela lutreola]|uniref:interferon lambda-4-like n=1 Tax=Mustela lutreola TaxID=9666 RepID=UPI002797B913|nr:interferon lambda-4-like [Mustela lutreola]
MGDGAGRGRGLANWRPLSPQSCARLRVVVRDLADAQAVLSRLPSPDRFPGTGPTLELLAAARRDVGACLELVRPGSWRKSLRPPRRRPPTRRAVSGAGGGAVRPQGGPWEVEAGWELRL